MAATALVLFIGGGAAAAMPPGFNADVRPVLSDKCFRCHGPDSSARAADLRLDRRDDAVASRDGRPAIVPGDPTASELVARIDSTDPDERMPPPGSGSEITAAERELLVAWIAAGATYEPHWAFVPPVAAAPPQVVDESTVRHPADRFIQARLEQLGIAPEPEADPATLCRRLHLDITGLPPTPVEVVAFVDAYAAAAGDPAARERVYRQLVDRLLDSPRYGEHMASGWLDAARYADTNGYQTDGPRQMWRYRDWVIDAFNRNQPFDEFTVEQLAGDLLPAPTLAQRIATGFNRNHRANAEGGVIPEEYLVEYVVDRVETTCTVWLGLTAGCARCHDHKYDPLSQRDFYRLFDFFNRVPERGRALRDANSPPLILAPTPAQEARRAELAAAAAAAARDWERLGPEIVAAEKSWVDGGGADAEADAVAVREGLTLRLPLAGDGAAEAATTISGPYGPAAVFDGTAPRATDEVPAFGTEKPFTAAVWLRPEAGDTATTVWSSWDAAELGHGAQFLLVHGRPQVLVSHREVDDLLVVEAAEPLEPGRWSHVTWTYDGSRQAAGLRMFVDGAAVATRTVRDELNSQFLCDRPLVVGGGGTAAAYRGALADLRFHDRVLEADELVANACGTPPPAIVKRLQAGMATAVERLALREHFLAHAPPPIRAARERLRAATRTLAAFERSLPTTMVMEDEPGLRTTHVLARGEYDKPGEQVTAGVPEAFALPLPEGVPADRLALARWLVDVRHPLTARVFVNRLWQRLFGTGLVKTVEDFGVQGETPPHRELLDWLAIEFRDAGGGWDVKRLVREIVTTAAYRRSSRVTPEAEARDPENRLFARGPRFRLPAETIRDAALAASGLLVEQIGGPSVKPYQPPGLWEELAAGKTTYDQDHGAALYRRSLYVYRKRTVSVPMFATFDAAARETCQVRQSRTNTPLQALTLLNDVAFVEAARGLAARMMREGGGTPAERIARGFRLVTSRAPGSRELDVLVAGFERRHAEFRRDAAAARALLAHGESAVDPALDAAELAAYATVGNVLLNLDEFLTRE